MQGYKIFKIISINCSILLILLLLIDNGLYLFVDKLPPALPDMMSLQAHVRLTTLKSKQAQKGQYIFDPKGSLFYHGRPFYGQYDE